MASNKSGVIFKDDDYAGFWRRLIIQVVDLIVIIGVLILCEMLDTYLYENYYSDNEYMFFYGGLFVSYLYLTVLKASRIGTVGQRLTDCKITTIFGKRPNIWLMTYRLAFWLVGPVNFIADLAFIYMNKEKRSLRDCLCNTIVIKRSAAPISALEKIRIARALVFGFHVVYETPSTANRLV